MLSCQWKNGCVPSLELLQLHPTVCSTACAHPFIIVMPLLLLCPMYLSFISSVVNWWPVMWHFLIWWRHWYDFRITGSLWGKIHQALVNSPEKKEKSNVELGHFFLYVRVIRLLNNRSSGWQCETTCWCCFTIRNIASCTLFYLGINFIVSASIRCFIWNDTLLWYAEGIRCVCLKLLMETIAYMMSSFWFKSRLLDWVQLPVCANAKCT